MPTKNIFEHFFPLPVTWSHIYFVY
jgi:hypothetical protein